MSAKLAFARQVTPPPLSPERVALAAAIIERNEFRGRLAATQAAYAAAGEAVRAADAKHRAAEAAVEPARAAATAHAIDVAAGRAAGAPPVAIRAARDAVVDAADELASAIAAHAALESELTDLTRNKDYPERRVADRAGAVLAASPQVAALVERLESLQREVFDCSRALLFLWGANAIPIGGQVGGFKERSAAERARGRIDMLQSNWHDLAADPTIPGAKPWQAVLAALMDDATASTERLR